MSDQETSQSKATTDHRSNLMSLFAEKQQAERRAIELEIQCEQLENKSKNKSR